MLIRPLSVEDSEELSKLLLRQKDGYIRYFRPFPFDAISIRGMLLNAKKDLFWGIFDGRMLGFFMLRGLGVEWSVPCFGVLIDKKVSGYGLLKLSLAFILAYARLRKWKRLMLHGSVDNEKAYKSYVKAGFRFSHMDGDQRVYMVNL